MRKQKISTAIRKLSIHKQTLRQLTGDEARSVAGGVPIEFSDLCTGSRSCPPKTEP